MPHSSPEGELQKNQDGHVQNMAAQSARNKPASEVLDTIFAATDAFTAGAPQHDDMTMLILKLDKSPATNPA